MLEFEHSWLILALMAAFLWGIVNLVDKVIVSGKTITIPARQVLDSLVGSLTVIALIPFASAPSMKLAGIGICAGLLVFAFNNFYYRSLKIGSVSSVSIHLQLIPIFSAGLGLFLFGEKFSFTTYLGGAVIIFSAVLSSIGSDTAGKFPLFLSKNMNVLWRYMLPATLFMSINYWFNKDLLTQYSILDVYLWGRIGTAIAGFGLYAYSPETRKTCRALVTNRQGKMLFQILVVELCNVTGIGLITAAFSVGTITLVTIATSTQPLWVLILLIVMALFRKTKVLADFSSDRKVLFLRIIAAFLQIGGIFLLANT